MPDVIYEPSLSGRIVYELVRFTVTGPLGCHIWQGATTERGYPVQRINGKVRMVRRVVYEREKRSLRPGERVEMTCGERLCVLADHMAATPARAP